MANRNPIQYLKEKGLYDDYMEWGKKIAFDKTYHRLRQWKRLVSDDMLNHKKEYMALFQMGYQHNKPRYTDKGILLKLYKDGKMAKVYFDQYQDICNQEIVDTLFQNAQALNEDQA